MNKQNKELQTLKELRSVNDLIGFVEKKGGNHNYYHHYTNLDSALAIIKSGYWYLSLGDVMNDKQELSKGSSEKWKNIFIASFVFGENENIAMWGLYSIPWQDAVRISIPHKTMRQWIEESNLFQIHKQQDIISYEPKWPNTKACLTDVVYIEGNRGDVNSKLRWNGEVLNIKGIPDLHNISDNPQITGYLKNSAWEYENEVRIKAELPYGHNQTKIAIKLPNNFINNLVLTAGPWIKDNFEQTIIEHIHRLKVNASVKETKYSGFRGLVDMKNHCSMCRHKFYMKAQ